MILYKYCLGHFVHHELRLEENTEARQHRLLQAHHKRENKSLLIESEKGRMAKSQHSSEIAI